LARVSLRQGDHACAGSAGRPLSERPRCPSRHGPEASGDSPEPSPRNRRPELGRDTGVKHYGARPNVIS
jgi:hypothetical protein